MIRKNKKKNNDKCFEEKNLSQMQTKQILQEKLET